MTLGWLGIKSLWPFLWKSPFKVADVLVNHLRLGTVFESPGKVELVVCCSSAQVSGQWRCFSPFRLFLIHKSLTKKYAFCCCCHIQWFMLSFCSSSWSYLSPVINRESFVLAKIGCFKKKSETVFFSTTTKKAGSWKSLTLSSLFRIWHYFPLFLCS